MNDTVLGAIIGAGATLVAVVPSQLSERRRRKAAERQVRERENAAVKAGRERERRALQQVIDLIHDVQFFDSQSVANYPDLLGGRCGWSIGRD